MLGELLYGGGRSMSWQSDSLKELQNLPKGVSQEVGHPLRVAQDVGRDPGAKPITGEVTRRVSWRL